MTRDPGLQPERTALAWQRTGLAAAAVSVVLALAALRADAAPVALLALAVTCTILVVAVRRFPTGAARSRPDVDERARGGAPRNSAWTALVTIVTLVCALAIVGVALAATLAASILLTP
ncbi:DUF202 domain-containing protein [Marisediminicola sp. LYQ134]|uniref:DUF202 domain-containing protein n=1 Tax=unclassified Marisediminicola TaxID=2618316 RepID=UPI003982F471